MIVLVFRGTSQELSTEVAALKAELAEVTRLYEDERRLRLLAEAAKWEALGRLRRR